MPTEQHIYNKMAEAIAYLEKSVSRQPGLFEVAGQAHLSPYHFQRTFKKYVGVTPKQYLRLLSLDQLKKRILQSGNLHLAADEVGFSSTSRIHDLFIRMEGITPGEFKSGGRELKIGYGFGVTPFGPAFIAFTSRGICKLSFIDTPQFQDERKALQGEWQHAELFEDHSKARELFNRMFAGGGQAIDIMAQGTPFQIKVWQALINIPDGALSTYSQIAKAIGMSSSARAVGSAIGKNPIAYIIPCHRVIRTDGGLGGYRWGLTRKKVLLANEGLSHQGTEYPSRS